ncbi:hypothetical protein HOD08_02160 [bacterium]|nr:hypothetical protein [bacterium]
MGTYFNAFKGGLQFLKPGELRTIVKLWINSTRRAVRFMFFEHPFVLLIFAIIAPIVEIIRLSPVLDLYAMFFQGTGHSYAFTARISPWFFAFTYILFFFIAAYLRPSAEREDMSYFKHMFWGHAFGFGMLFVLFMMPPPVSEVALVATFFLLDSEAGIVAALRSLLNGVKAIAIFLPIFFLTFVLSFISSAGIAFLISFPISLLFKVSTTMFVTEVIRDLILCFTSCAFISVVYIHVKQEFQEVFSLSKS